MKTVVQPVRAERRSVSADWQAISDELYSRGMTDGLPIVPPTEDRVGTMVEASGRDALDVVAVLVPRKGTATVELVAANAVMAGCGPEHFPAVLTAVECIAQPEFGLDGILTSTHNSSVLLMLNGPIVEALDIDHGGFPEPQRWRSTAVIGRALTLVLLNVAGVPGATFNETQGALVRYTRCFAENEKQSPWSPLHVDRGFAPDTSTVTAIPAMPPQHVDDMGSTSARSVLMTMADSIANVGNRNTNGEGEPWVILGPQHAATVARDGWSKADVQRYLHDAARVPFGRFPPEIVACSFSARWQRLYNDGDFPQVGVPIAERPEDITVVVSGGAGTHSLFVQTQLGMRSVTRPVAWPPGSTRG